MNIINRNEEVCVRSGPYKASEVTRLQLGSLDQALAHTVTRIHTHPTPSSRSPPPFQISQTVVFLDQGIHQQISTGLRFVEALAAMAFAGTQQKCKACAKTVYVVDQLTADNVVYHKACFRCHHCNGTLKLSNYSSFEGTLYCKPHFDQLFKRTGSLDKSFESGVPKTPKSADRGFDGDTKTPTKYSSIFSGTQEKCLSCSKTVYPIEKVSVDGMLYHKACFKCCHGGCSLSPSNYVAHEGRLYCRHHNAQLFKEKGDFSQLEKLPAVKSGSAEDV